MTEGWRWVRYATCQSAGLTPSMMWALRQSGLLEARDVSDNYTIDWQLYLPSTAEGMTELIEAVKAIQLLRAERDVPAPALK